MKTTAYNFPLSKARIACWLAALALLFCPCAWTEAADYAIGADLSFLKQAEDRGTVFKDNGQAKPGLQIFKDHGYNWNWNNFAELVQAGIRGVDAGRGTNARPRIMIHIDKGGNWRATKSFFDKLNSYGVDFDVIGQSYYPWWHGSLLDLRENLNFMANAYQKDIILVEVAYNWRSAEYRNKPAPFPETPEGQREFLEEVNRIAFNTPHHRCIGVFWWEPAVTGRLRSRGFFDEDGNALPVIQVFDRFTRK